MGLSVEHDATVTEDLQFSTSHIDIEASLFTFLFERSFVTYEMVMITLK